MLTLRYFLRLIEAFIKRFKAIIFIGIIIGFFAFLSIVLFSRFFGGRIKETIGITGRYQTEDLPRNILNQIGDGLTKADREGNITSGLAQSWENRENGRIWVFHLKDDVFWHDGKKVTADTVKYEFEDVKIERPDSKTLIFELKTPFSPFPSVVSRPTFKQGLLGTGNWKVVKVSVAGTYLEKLVLENKKGDRKIYKFFPTEEKAKLAFKLGSVNKIEDIIDAKPFSDWKTTEVTPSINENRFMAIFLNTEDGLLSDKSLRQALSYSLKKDFPGTRALGPISPVSWAYNSQVKIYAYDLKRAQELMNDLPKEIKNNLKIKLVTSPILLSTAEEIAREWGKIGIETIVQVISVIPENYQAYLAIYDIPLDPDQYSTWHSTQKATNISHYKNPRIDKLLEDGRTELQIEVRKKIYLDFQRFLLEDVPAIFLSHPVTYTIERK